MRVQPVLKRLQKFAIKNSPGCLGFAPRSNSLVYEPAVLSNSIFSLSGLALRRPSANPLSCCARIKRAYVFCFKEILSFRKSTSHSARLRWTLHQGSSPNFENFQINKRMGLTHPFIYEKTPQVGLEPTTYRLTAGCSAIELLRIKSVSQLHLLYYQIKIFCKEGKIIIFNHIFFTLTFIK